MPNTLIRLDLLHPNANKTAQASSLLCRVIGSLLVIVSIFLLVIPVQSPSISTGVALAMSIIGAPACMVAAILLIAAD